MNDKTYAKYSYEEIEKHTNEKMGIWTTYKNNIYVITDFVDIHPGGKDKILLAAGNSVEPYWEKYTQHVTVTLNKNIIPTTAPKDMLDCKKLKVPISDFKIYLLMEESKLRKENPKISTIPAKISKFLV